MIFAQAVADGSAEERSCGLCQLDRQDEQQAFFLLPSVWIDMLDPLLNLKRDDRSHHDHLGPWGRCWAADDRQIRLLQRRHDLFLPADGERNEGQL